MKAYRTLPRTDAEHEKDMERIAFAEGMIEVFEKSGWDESKQYIEWSLDLYAELEETHSELESVKEDRDYYKQRCRDEGTY